jgi:hypothetical protein
MIAKTNPGPVRGARRPEKQDGYAIMMVAFMTTIIMLTAIVAAPSVRTERRREQEEEMIWRGKQYVHAIKLYYRKNGRFPTNIDDLSKPKNGSLRYLRQVYKDPMNKEDGKWRLIYVGPSGQLVGSTKPQQTIQISGGASIGTPAGQAGFGSTQGQGQGNSQSAFGGSSFGSSNNNSAFGSQGGFGSQNNTNPNGNNGQPNPNGAAGTSQNQDPNAPASGDASGNSNQTKDVDTSSFVGGNIIGIGSKANHKSVIVYEKATNYHQFEFIWDPSKDTMGMGGTGSGAGTGAFGQSPGQGINGNNPNGSSFGGSSFGGSSFGQPSQNPNGNAPMTPPPNGGQNPSSQPPPNQP